MKNLKDSLKAGFEEMARKKGEMKLSPMSAGGGGAKSPMSAGGGGAKSPKKQYEQEMMNSLITFRNFHNPDGDKAADNILYNFEKMSNDEILTLIENSPTKTTQKEKEEILERIKSSGKTPSSTKMGKKKQEKQAAEIISGIPIILSDFEKNIKKVEDIYEVISKSPGEKVTKDQIRTINDFLPPDRKITAGAGRVRVGQALKELEELYIEESRNQKIRQLPGESANIVTPMQTPASKDAKKLIFSTGPRKSSV
jgi:hypothetical protein